MTEVGGGMAEVSVVARELADALGKAAGSDWQTVTLQGHESDNHYSMKAAVDGAPAVEGPAFDVDSSFVRRLRSALEAPTGSLAIELTLHASGEFEFEHLVAPDLVAYWSGYDGQSWLSVADHEFRYPGFPLPGMPLPATASTSDQETDPAVLARVSSLVTEFSERYTAIKGRAPDFGPGNSESEIAAAEAALGVRLPEELRALYRVISHDNSETGLLSRCSLYPLKHVVEQYREHGPGTQHEHFHPMDVSRMAFEAIPLGRVKRLARNDWWITFGTDYGGDIFAVDLDPAEAGRSGQVLETGRNIYGPIRYVAESVTAMLEQVVRCLRSGEYDAEEAEYDLLETTPAFCDETAHDSYSGRVELTSAQDDAEWTVHPDVQELHVNAKKHVNVDLAGLAPLHMVRDVSVYAREGAVSPRVPAEVPVEALSIVANAVQLDMLAGHPTLRDLTLKGIDGPVDLQPLTRLRALAKLHLSTVDVADLTVLAKIPSLRVLTLNPRQWHRLRESGPPLTGLVVAEITGSQSLDDALDWSTWLTGRPDSARPQRHRITGTLVKD